MNTGSTTVLQAHAYTHTHNHLFSVIIIIISVFRLGRFEKCVIGLRAGRLNLLRLRLDFAVELQFL